MTNPGRFVVIVVGFWSFWLFFFFETESHYEPLAVIELSGILFVSASCAGVKVLHTKAWHTVVFHPMKLFSGLFSTLSSVGMITFCLGIVNIV
jgi:hypothetical protein